MGDKYYATFNAVGSLSQWLVASIHTIPKTAVPVDDDMWMRLTQESDGIWMLGAAGAITKGPLPVVKFDYVKIERQWRDGEIEAIKWLRERHRDQLDLSLPTTLTATQFVELLDYLQLLRDWPQAKSFPDQKYRPTIPAWIAEQNS